jgi:hypothetical protein
MQLAPPINIFSGEPGLGGALTNPTELARQKGCIQQSYPITFAGRHWPDVETAYKRLKRDTPAENDALMVELIATKLRQHTRLRDAITARGGVAWLKTCSHHTNARSESFQSWEGTGEESRFIRDLVAGYEASFSDEVIQVGQAQLF